MCTMIKMLKWVAIVLMAIAIILLIDIAIVTKKGYMVDNIPHKPLKYYPEVDND